MALPDPPAGELDFGTRTWAAGRPFYRVYRDKFGPNSFNSSRSSARFRPFPSSGNPIPTMYGSSRVDGALGESVFHDVPAGRGTWVIPRSGLLGQLRTMLVPQRKLELVDLTGWAFKRLGLRGRALVECEPAEYPITARWAERFHASKVKPDGIYWTSRQFDKAAAFILFGDRVERQELDVILDETVGLWQGEGLDEVLAAAELAGVTVAF
jgi:hypothetical protein